MKILVSYDDRSHPPVLRLTVHDAPHRRVHIEVIRSYRDALRMAFRREGIHFPIEDPIDLEVTFINPTTPDLGNAYLALEQAMDGTTLTGPGIVTDDSLISSVKMQKLFINQKKPAVQPVNLPRFVHLQAVA